MEVSVLVILLILHFIFVFFELSVLIRIVQMVLVIPFVFVLLWNQFEVSVSVRISKSECCGHVACKVAVALAVLVLSEMVAVFQCFVKLAVVFHFSLFFFSIRTLLILGEVKCLAFILLFFSCFQLIEELLFLLAQGLIIKYLFKVILILIVATIPIITLSRSTATTFAAALFSASSHFFYL